MPSAIRHLPFVILFLATFLAYLPALRAGWIWDDDYYVTKNQNLYTVEGLKNIWTKFGLSEGGTPQYYPVTHTTFWIEYHLWGLRPAGYHAVNILLHATNAVLLWLILKRLSVPGAWLAACIFALHPVHVESVAWVTERKNTLSGLFYLSAMLIYLPLAGLAGAAPSMRSRRLRHALLITLFVLALLSKSVTASLPAAMLLVIWWKRGRIAVREVLPLVPMFILAIGMGALTSWMERTHVGATGPDWDLSIWQRVLIAGRAVWFYAMKLVAPLRLSFIYPRWEVDPTRFWQWLFPIAAVGLVVLLFIMRKRCGRGPVVAVLFFGGTLLPALGFVNLLPMRYSFVADHFQYLASIGLIVLFVATASTLLRAWRTTLAVTVLLSLGVLTFRQSLVYADVESLWRDTIAKNATGWMPRNNLANLRIAEGRLDDAESLLIEALKHNPEQPEVLINLGVIAERRGELSEAFELYRRSAQREPSGAALTNMGWLLLNAGRVDEATELFQQATEVEPRYAVAYRLLGIAQVQRNELQGAAQSLRRATELDPASADGWNYLGATLEKLHDYPGAIHAYQRAIALKPSLEQARRNLERVRNLQ